MSALAEKLAALEAMPAAEVREMWQHLFRRPVPPHSSHLLRRQIGWRWQAKVEGDLSPAVARQLVRAAQAGVGGKADAPRAAESLARGTRLIRDWNGRHIEVLVAEDAYEHDGRHYRSLSQIARHVTGVRWSGPRFFGLTTRKKGDG